MDYYEPPCLFRQKAIRRSPSPNSGGLPESKAFLTAPSSTHPLPWLMRQRQEQDTMVMSKACSLDRANIKSNYWKIPDTQMNLTALALSDPQAASPLLAISSGSTNNNLFIHELDPLNQYLTHHTTISLPNIHALAWVPNADSRFLISGNNKGYAHLVSVPRPVQNDGLGDDECAEIVKRFNHRKHLRLVNKDPELSSHVKTCITEIGFLADDQLATCYDDTLFVWNINGVELAMRPRPESISVVPGIRSFDPASTNKTTLALCGAFGVSLFDTRTTQHSVPQSSLRHKSSLSLAMTNKVKWHPQNEHLFASSDGDGVVRLWDIRKQDTFAELTGHRGKTVTSMSWNGNDLFTGASDGNIVHWDLTSNLDPQEELSLHGEKILQCSLREGINSVAFDPVSNSMVNKVNERQCGTALPALNNKIVGLCPVLGSRSEGTCNILLIDGAAFLGLHCKIYDAARTSTDDREFYSPEDMALIKQHCSSETVVAPEAVTRPLSVARKTLVASEETLGSTSTTDSMREMPIIPRLDSSLSHLFSKAFLDKWEEEVVSLYSVDSLPEHEVSPYSSGLLENSSIYSLSTVATLIEPSVPVMPKDSLFMELEGLFNEMPGTYAGL